MRLINWTVISLFVCVGSHSLAETCLTTTNEQAVITAVTPDAVIAAIADAQAFKPRIQRFRDRLIITIDVQKMKEDLPAPVSGPIENFVEAVRRQAVQEHFAYFVCDTVRPMFEKFKELGVIEVHGFLEVEDPQRGDKYDQKQMWAAYRRITANKIKWFPPDRRHILDVVTQADNYSFRPSVEFGRFR
jgi:hypothetical protein